MIVRADYDCVLPIIDHRHEADHARCASAYEVTEDDGFVRYFLVHGKTDVVMTYTAEEVEEMCPKQQPADVIPFRAAEGGPKRRLIAVA